MWTIEACLRTGEACVWTGEESGKCQAACSSETGVQAREEACKRYTNYAGTEIWQERSARCSSLVRKNV